MFLVCVSGTERSGAPQGCLPSSTGSAPERSGGAEAGDDYLRRSAPVKRSAAKLTPEADRVERMFCMALLKVCGTSPTDKVLQAYIHWKDNPNEFDSLFEEAADSGQRSAPKAESVATDGGSSGAQARNDQAQAQPPAATPERKVDNQ